VSISKDRIIRRNCYHC